MSKNPKQKTNNPIIPILGGALLLIVALAIISPHQSTPTPTVQSTPSSTTEKTKAQEPAKYGFNSTLTVDGIKMTIGESYTFETIVNKYSEHNGKPAIKIPIYMENISGETNNTPIFFTIFDPSGVQVSGDVGALFDHDATAYVTQLRPQASCQKYLYIVYLGDGLYSADIKDYSTSPSTTKTMEFNIVR